MSYDRTRPHSRWVALVLAALVTLGTAVPLVGIALLIDLVLFFEQGGSFGGFGASATANYVPQMGLTIIAYAVLLLAILLPIVFGVGVYRQVRNGTRRNRSARR